MHWPSPIKVGEKNHYHHLIAVLPEVCRYHKLNDHLNATSPPFLQDTGTVLPTSRK